MYGAKDARTHSRWSALPGSVMALARSQPAAFAPAERPPREVVESAGWRAVASASIADRARAWRPDLIPRARSMRAEAIQREDFAIWSFAPRA